MKKISIFLMITAVLAACSAKITMLTQADADRAAVKYTGTTLATLNEGKALYEQNCGLCHGLKKPNTETEAAWTQIVPDMVNKVNAKLSKQEIDSREQQEILAYLVTMGAAK
jgi:cytochrome c5